MADYLHNHLKPLQLRDRTPASRMALDQSDRTRLAHRLRTLIEADERSLRPRPITLPRLPSLDRR